MDAVMVDAMVVEAVRAERERIKGRLKREFILRPWIGIMTQRDLLQCVEEEVDGASS